MSGTNRNFVVSYVVLVGLPILALAGVLRLGRGLIAPASVNGLWKIEFVSDDQSSFPCAKTLASNANLQISQSGKDLSLTLNASSKIPATGTLEGTILKASFAPPLDSNATSCGAAQYMNLVATLDPKAEPRTLTGKFSLANCPICAPIEFHATRQPTNPRDGAR